MAVSRFQQLQDKDWLEAQALAGLTKADVARSVGCTPSNVVRAATLLGVVFPVNRAEATATRHLAHRFAQWPQLADRLWLVDQLVTQDKTLRDVAAILDCSVRPVIAARDYHNIPARADGKGPRRQKTRVQKRIFPKLQDHAWLRERLAANVGLDEIATEVGCSAATVGRAISDAGIERVIGRPAGTRSTVYHQLADKGWLSTEYLNKDRDAQSMADEVGCSVWAMRTALSRFRILKNPERLQGKQDTTLPVGTIRKDGYLLVFKPEHPNANGKGYVPQHRLVCEEALGRLLTPQEEVHHCNENRSDNRIENLLVMPDYKAHMDFHRDPPAWVPRCACCARVRPELVLARPEGVPLLYDEKACYGT